MPIAWNKDNGYILMVNMLSIGILLGVEDAIFCQLAMVSQKEKLNDFLINYFFHYTCKIDVSVNSVNFLFPRPYVFIFTFYPVFVNIIDNAIYWLKQSDVPEKVIRLHADDTGIYISNNGIEIKPQDKERIFELRFSRKPNGRGLGLSISKEVLNAENYDIFVAQPKEGSTVTFKIQKMQ